MRNASVLMVLAVTGSALAQNYLLLPSSTMTREVCLPPCPCPYESFSGPLYREFVLTPLDGSPPYTRYTVSFSYWAAPLGSQGTVYFGGTGIYTIGGDSVPMHRLELTVSEGPQSLILTLDSGLVPADPAHPFPQIAIEVVGEAGCTRERLRISAAPRATVCYANCDESTTPPILTANDFQCYLNAFAAGNMWADCDENHMQMLTGNDFQCFLNRFATGCN